MDISKTIAELKKDPDFSQNVGMILVHNGVVRGHSRADKAQVECVEVTPDLERMEELRREYEQKPGIYKILTEAKSGRLEVGDDVLFIVVAGDFRENVKAALSELLDRIKSEAVMKNEVCVE